jgi:hypothetical protein
MRLGRLVILAIVVLSLGAYIYFVERHAPSTDEIKQRQDKLFPTMDQAKIQRVVVTNAKGRFELKKENDAWKLTAPLADDANSGAVTGLLSSLVGLKAERTLSAKDVKLAEYGLDKPALSVSVTDDKGVSSTLSLGVEMPLGNNRAAQTGGGTVYMIGKYIGTDLDKDLSGWRSTTLAQVYSTDAASLTVKDAAGRVALAQAGGVWALTEPVADLAEREKADGVISDISAAQIKEFVDAPGDLKALGLDPPLLEVTIVRKDNKPPVQLAFGSERDKDGAKQRACRRGERVYWVEATAAAKATTAIADWRSKKLVHLDTWAADKLELEAGKEKESLERKDGIWKAGSVEVDGDAVSRRLNTLADMTVAGFDRPKPAGQATGHVKLTVEDSAIVEATFYAGAGAGEAIAVVPGRAGALAVDGAKVKELLADPPSLAKPKPTPTPVPTPRPAATEKPAVPAIPAATPKAEAN